MTGRGPRARSAGRAAGSRPALTAVAAAVVGRVSAVADQPALTDALAAVAGNARGGAASADGGSSPASP